MSKVTKEAKATNVFNIFNVWSNNVDALERIEEQSIQAIGKQKEWIDSTCDQLTEFEAVSKKLTSEWKNNVQEGLAKNPNVYGEANYTEWVNKLEEISHISQNLAFSPAKASLEIFAKSHSNFETIFVNTLEQQQKNRADFLKPFENASEQLKQTQEKLFKPFEDAVEQLKQTQEKFLKSFELPAK
jgi:Polyhydroxyalkanoic acid inclusion protein (PhaP_Bmeg)